MHQGIVKNFFAPQDCLYPHREPDQSQEAGQPDPHYLNLLVAIVDQLYRQA